MAPHILNLEAKAQLLKQLPRENCVPGMCI